MPAPQIPADLIAQQLANRSRKPFLDKVQQILECGPTDGAIINLAERNPDRWGQLLAMLARLGGYTEKLEVEASIAMSINSMSDAELEAETAALKCSLDVSSNGSLAK